MPLRDHLIPTGISTLALISAAPLWAEALDAPRPDVADAAAATALSGVVVTAARLAQPLEAVGASVTVLDAADLRAAQWPDVASLIERTPGLNVARNGGLGTATSVFIRGADSDQTVVVIDGVKVNDPSTPGAGFDFGGLLVGDVSRIEVLRGAQSTLWGGQAMGGVVNIVTAAPTRPFEAGLDLEGGARETQFARVNLGGVQDRLTWRLGAGRFETAGVSAYRFGREADGAANRDLSGRLEYRISPDLSLDLRAVDIRSRADFDGYAPPDYAFGDTREFAKTRNLVVYSGLNIDLLGGRLRNRLAYGFTELDHKNYDTDQTLTPVTYDALGTNRRVEYQGVLDLGATGAATFGAERETSAFRTASPSSDDPSPPTARARTGVSGVYVQLNEEVLRGLNLAVGLRDDRHDAFGAHLTGQASAAWRLNAGGTILRASFGQGFKAPTLFQLYSVYGDAALRPETAETFDAGVEQRLLGDAARITLTAFHKADRNLIAYVGCPGSGADPKCSIQGAPRYGYYRNIDQARSDGLELSGAARLGRLSLSGDYTLTEARNLSAGAAYDRRLFRRPENLADAAATYDWTARLSTTFAVRYSGEAFDDEANAVRLKSYLLLDLRGVWRVSDRVELYGRIENLTDAVHETAHDYGSTGRGLFVGLRARL